MSLIGECRDINGLAVKHGLMYMAGPGECHQCVCENGVPKNCQDVMCHQPQNCSTFRKGARCCDFVCLDDLSTSKSDIVGLDGDFGLRLVASIITAILSFSLLFFLVHRLRQRKMRSGRQNRQLSEDERSLGSIGYITGSLGYLPSAMERYEEPTAHFPHYPLWKPPGNYFPRGEAPPPYEEAVAATRAEALAAAMASGALHTNPSNFGRDSLLGVNYNTYTSGNLLGGTGHRTIPINLATSASFTLQPERFDDASSGGGTCVSVATGTVSVTATVTAPPISRTDIIHSEIPNVRQGDASSRSSTLRRSEIATRAEVSLRTDSNLRPDFGRRPELNTRPDTFQWSDASFRSDAGYRSDGPHCPDSGHCSDTSHRSDAGHRPDASQNDPGHRLGSVFGVENNQRSEPSHHDILRNDGNHLSLRKENVHHLDPPLHPVHLEINDRSSKSDLHHRHDFPQRDMGRREGLWRSDPHESVNYQRVDDRRLPSMPLPENSNSLPPHSHGMNLQGYSGGPAHLSHSYGRQPQAPASILDVPLSVTGQEAEPKERRGNSSKPVAPQLTNVPKSGTSVYEDSFHALPQEGAPVTATLRKGKQHGSMGTMRRNPLPVATPKPKILPLQTMTSDLTSSTSGVPISSAICIPTAANPCNNMTMLNASPSTATASGIAAPSLSRCTCPKATSLRCTCPGSCHSSIVSLAVNESPLPQNSNLSLAQAGVDDNDDYRSECENCKSTHSSNYYLDAEDPEPEITMTLHRKPTDTNEENGNGFYRTSLTLPTRHRVAPLHGIGARDNWFSSMPESSSEDESEDE